MLVSGTVLYAMGVTLLRTGTALSLFILDSFPSVIRSFLTNDQNVLIGFLVSLLIVAILVDQLSKARLREHSSTKKIVALEDEIKQKTIEAQRFQQSVENSSEASAIALPDLRFVYVNPAWQKLTGFSKEEALGQNLAIIQSPSMKQHVTEEMLRISRQGQSYHSEECVFRKKNGEEYFAEQTMYPIMQHGKPIFFVIIHHDITTRVRSDNAKSEFISLASHQLRTPLTALRLTLGALLRGQLGKVEPEAEQAATRAMEYVIRMAEIVHTMLNISQMEEGRMKPVASSVDIASLLASARTEFEFEISRKNQTCTIECPDDLNCSTDKALLREVVSNLLANALRYTPSEGTVTMTARRERDTLRLEVRDSGCGIPSYQTDKIFTKFFRGENVKKMDTAGTGLGLYLVHAIVTMLDGSVSFTSVEGEGTIFTVLLPLLPAYT